MQIVFEAAERRRNQLQIGRLDDDRPESRHGEQLLFAHPSETVIRRQVAARELRRSRTAVVDDADDLEHLRQQPQRMHLACRMLVANADLTDSDLFHNIQLLCFLR